MADVTTWIRHVVSEQRARNALRYDATRKFITLGKGELVIVRVPTRKGKLSPQYIGPCEILDAESPLIYIVRDPRSGAEMRVHVERLRRYVPLQRLSEPDEHAAEQLADASPTLLGRQVAKHFDNHGVCYGTVVRIDDYIRVKYEDGDTEDYTLDEIKKILVPANSERNLNAASHIRVEDNDMVVIRSKASGTIYIGRAVATFPDTNEFNFHYYQHDKVGKKFDLNLPLHERVGLQPEYYFFTKANNNLRHYGTHKPRPHVDKPYVALVNPHDFDVLATKFELERNGSLPREVIDEITITMRNLMAHAEASTDPIGTEQNMTDNSATSTRPTRNRQRPAPSTRSEDSPMKKLKPRR